VTAHSQIPVSVVTGFLGAGKTTLLNRMLRAPELAHALVIVNEWGEIGLDHLLVERIEGDIVLLSSGCLCCSLRGDLVEALRDLSRRRDAGRLAPFGHVVIETSGLSDPGPILGALMADEALARRYRLAGVVTLIDAVNGLVTLRDNEVSLRQVALADRLAISKSDLLDAETRGIALAALRTQLGALNPGAAILDVAASGFAIAEVLSIGPGTGLAAGPPPRRAGRGFIADDPAPGRHDARLRAYDLRLAEPVAPQALDLFLASLRALLGPKLLRMKGLIGVATHPEGPFVLHAVQHLLPPLRRLSGWPDADRTTRIVAIVDGLDRVAIDRLWAALAGAPAIDAPDLAALTLSPLSLPRGGLFD
jgi:G3E family GTPase